MERENLGETLRSIKKRESKQRKELQRKHETMVQYHNELDSVLERAAALFEKVGVDETQQRLDYRHLNLGGSGSETWEEASVLIPVGAVDLKDRDGQTHGFARIYRRHRRSYSSHKRKFRRREYDMTTTTKVRAIDFYAGTAEGTDLRHLGGYHTTRDYREGITDNDAKTLDIDALMGDMESPATRSSNWDNFAKQQQSLSKFNEALLFMEQQLGIVSEGSVV